MESALHVAKFLEAHPAVERVVYPGLTSHPQHDLAKRQMVDVDGNFAPGTLVYFVLKGTHDEARAAGRKIMNHLAENALSVTLAVSLGQIRTLIEHPASMTHAPLPVEAQVEAGLDPGGIRISLGIENAADIESDLGEALDSL
jgi:cystathionine beta-lyase/cystathionine gamma-synthase